MPDPQHPTPAPTVGRVVLVRVLSEYNKEIDVPAIIAEVHSPVCVSVVALSAFEVVWGGTKFRGAQPLTSLTINDNADDVVPRVNSWRWMPFQVAQANKIEITPELIGEAVAACVAPHLERIAALEEAINILALTMPMQSPSSPSIPAHQPSIFQR